MRFVLEWLLRKSDRPNLFGNLLILAFVVVQILDGVLTYKGVNAWGMRVEVNLIVGLVMSIAGIGYGLILVKTFAVGCGALLYWRRLHNVIAVVVAIYMMFAIFSWMYTFLIF